ncbi:Protein of unknown function C-terminus [Sinosporangium album]|uniref:DUF2399 domain-containing protein n=1 Tax=Sinosporangium album TaxID=504805 RepID=A0A1G8B6H5_9ACTN|nr:Protein of unknown function C-terminus [Sinosporangium album]
MASCVGAESPEQLKDPVGLAFQGADRVVGRRRSIGAELQEPSQRDQAAEIAHPFGLSRLAIAERWEADLPRARRDSQDLAKRRSESVTELERLTLRQLRRHDAAMPAGAVRLCENPVVVAAAADQLGADCAPLLCVNGRPSAAVWRLLDLLAQGGSRFAYHGDVQAARRVGDRQEDASARPSDVTIPVTEVREMETISTRTPIPSRAVTACSSETFANANREAGVSGTPSLSRMP